MKDIYRKIFSSNTKVFYIPIYLRMNYIFEAFILSLIGNIAIIFF